MAGDNKSIYAQLREVQFKVKAPKSEASRFGKSRSAELILEQVKPLCHAEGLTLVTSEELLHIEGRFYIKSTATVFNDEGKSVEAVAYAREGDVERGLDPSQVTGKTSSYAKKYALQNLFELDDTKDADFEPNRAAVDAVHRPAIGTEKKTVPVQGAISPGPATDKQKKLISDKLVQIGVPLEDQRGYIIEQYGVDMPLTKKGASFVIEELIGGENE